MAAANEAMDNTVRDFQKLKTSLHRQMVDVIDFHKAEELTESELREQLRSLADYLCTQQSLSLDTQQRETMVSEIMDEIYGFGPIESLMVDPQVTDILINGPDRVLVERKGLLESTNIRFADADHLMRFIHRLVGRAGRRIDESSPIVDARLPDGSRFNAVIPPLALCGPTVSIRRFGHRRLQMEDMINHGSHAGHGRLFDSGDSGAHEYDRQWWYRCWQDDFAELYEPLYSRFAACGDDRRNCRT